MLCFSLSSNPVLRKSFPVAADALSFFHAIRLFVLFCCEVLQHICPTQIFQFHNYLPKEVTLLNLLLPFLAPSVLEAIFRILRISRGSGISRDLLYFDFIKIFFGFFNSRNSTKLQHYFVKDCNKSVVKFILKISDGYFPFRITLSFLSNSKIMHLN